MSKPIRVNRWKVTFEYRNGHNPIRVIEWVHAPTKLLALWTAREQRHGCMIADPDCIHEIGPYVANLKKS
jgi:hypothetical protein